MIKKINATKIASVAIFVAIVAGIAIYWTRIAGQTPEGIKPSEELLKSDLFSLKFSFEGKELQFPLKVGEFKKAIGWSIKTGNKDLRHTNSMIEPHNVVINELLHFHDFGRYVYIGVENDTDRELPFEECSITRMRFENNNYEALGVFKRTCTLILPKGIMMAKKSSTRQEVIAAYGEPTKGEEDMLEYSQGDVCIRFLFWPGKEEMLHVEFDFEESDIYD